MKKTYFAFLVSSNWFGHSKDCRTLDSMTDFLKVQGSFTLFRTNTYAWKMISVNGKCQASKRHPENQRSESVLIIEHILTHVAPPSWSQGKVKLVEVMEKHLFHFSSLPTLAPQKCVISLSSFFPCTHKGDNRMYGRSTSFAQNRQTLCTDAPNSANSHEDH